MPIIGKKNSFDTKHFEICLTQRRLNGRLSIIMGSSRKIAYDERTSFLNYELCKIDNET